MQQEDSGWNLSLWTGRLWVTAQVPPKSRLMTKIDDTNLLARIIKRQKSQHFNAIERPNEKG